MHLVGRVIAVGPGGRAQAPDRDDRYRAVIEAARAAGLLDELLLSPRCRSYSDADEMRRGLLRSARYYCSCGAPHCTRRHKNYPAGDQPGGCPDGGQRISARDVEVVTVTDGKGHKHYHVQFQLHDKQEAIRALILKYGPDPSRWPYNPRARKLKGA